MLGEWVAGQGDGPRGELGDDGKDGVEGSAATANPVGCTAGRAASSQCEACI